MRLSVSFFTVLVLLLAVASSAQDISQVHDATIDGGALEVIGDSPVPGEEPIWYVNSVTPTGRDNPGTRSPQFDDFRTYHLCDEDCYCIGQTNDFKCDDPIYFKYDLSGFTCENEWVWAEMDVRIQYDDGSGWETYYQFDYEHKIRDCGATSFTGCIGFIPVSSFCNYTTCDDTEFQIKITATDGWTHAYIRHEHSFELEENIEPSVALSTIPSNPTENDLEEDDGNQYLRVRVSATDNTNVHEVRLRYRPSGGSYVYIPGPDSGDWQSVGGDESITHDFLVPIDDPYEGLSYDLRGYARDCDGNEDYASLSLTILDGDTEPPVIANVTWSEGTDSDGDGRLEVDEDVKLCCTVTDNSGVASVYFGDVEVFESADDTYCDEYRPTTPDPLSVTIKATDDDDYSPLVTTLTASTPIVPRDVTVCFAANEPGVTSITVDGTSYPLSECFNWIVGEIHTLVAEEWFDIATGHRLGFAEWGSGETDLTLEYVVFGDDVVMLIYRDYYYLTVGTDPDGVASIPGEGWYLGGDPVTLNAPPTAGDYVFDEWVLDGTPQTPPSPALPVVMDAPHEAIAHYQQMNQVGIDSSPTGVPVTVDGTVYPTPASFDWETGSSHEITFPAVHGDDGCQRLLFTQWQDDAPNPRTYVVSGAANLVGEYDQQYFLDVSTDPADVVVIPGEGWHTEDAVISLDAPASAGALAFQGWTIDGSGTTPGDLNPVGVTMDDCHTAVAGYASLTNVYLQASATEVCMGDQLTVDVITEDVVNLYGYGLSVSYDTANLQVVSVDDGGFLGSDGGAVFPLPPTIDEANGLISDAGASRLTPGVGMNGTGALITIVFDVTGDDPDVTEITVVPVPGTVLLSDPYANPIPVGTVTGVTVDYAAPECYLDPPAELPVCGSTGNTHEGPEGFAGYEWSIDSATEDWVITDGQYERVVTFDAGSMGWVLLTLTVTDENGCQGTCDLLFDPQSPVEGSFYAVENVPGTVTLRWSLASTAGITGLNIYRSLTESGPYSRLNQAVLEPAAVNMYEDSSVWLGTTFWYDLRVVLPDGSEDTTTGSPVFVTTSGSVALSLHPASPNPTRGSTTLVFDVPAYSSSLELVVYDLRGRVVRRIAEGPHGPGRYHAEWDGRDYEGRQVSAGVYFARLMVDEVTRTGKVLVIR